MKKLFSAVLSAAMLASLAVPVGAESSVGKVVGLQQISGGTDSVKFEWDKVFGENVYYEIQMGTTADSLATVEKDTEYTDYSVGELKAGSTYYTRVRALSEDGGVGAWSDAFELVTSPNYSNNLMQTNCTDKTATFKWDAVKGATRYQIIHRIDDSDKVLATSKKTSATIKGLSNKTTLSGDIYIRTIRDGKNFSACMSPNYMWTVDYISGPNMKLTPKKSGAPKINTIYTGLQSCYFAYQKVPYADTYHYELYGGNNKKLSSGTSDNVSAKPGQFYKLRARGSVTIASSSKTKYGAWSGYKYFGYGLNASAKKINKKKNIQVQWKKFTGATDYVVYISKTSKGGFKKVGTTKKTVYKISKIGKSKLSKKQKYYVKITARKIVNKKVVTSTTTKVTVNK